MDSACERAILGIVLVILVGGPLAFGASGFPFGDIAFVVIQGLTILALGLWMVRFYVQRPFRLFWPPVCWGVLAFVAYAIARCQMVVIEYPAQQLLVKVIVYAVLFFIVLHNLNRRESATAVGMTLIAVGMVLSVFAVYQFATHNPKIWGYYKPAYYTRRGSGTFINPNNLAGFLEMIAPLGLAYVIMGRFSAVVKAVVGYATIAMLVGIAVTVSRGAMLATGSVMVLFCLALLYDRRYWKRALAALLVFAAGAIYCARDFTIERRFLGAMTGDGKVFDNRYHYWDGAKEIFSRHVWWGAGPGHFPFEYPRFRDGWAQNTMLYAHNDYLNTLCEWGIVGMAIIGLTMMLLYWGAVRTWPFVRKASNEMGSSDSTRAAFVAGSAAGLLALLIHSVVDFDMQIPACAIVAITFMALLTAQRRFATERYWKNPAVFGKFLVFCVAGGAMVFLSLREARNGRETYWLWQGALLRRDWEAQSAILAKSPDSTQASKAIAKIWDEELAALTKAYDADPSNFQTSFTLGQYYWTLSRQGGRDYKAQCLTAMKWFTRSMQANPRYAYTPMRFGMCLDWLDRPHEATPYFNLAADLDPNSFYVAIYEGLHCVNLSDLEGARRWLQRSVAINGTDPEHTAQKYLDNVNRMIQEAARAQKPRG